MFWRRRKSKFDEPQSEPLFSGIGNDDREMLAAYKAAAESLRKFFALAQEPGDHTCAVKLRFRDPVLSDRLREDRYVYLWLAGARLGDSGRTLTAEFFEVPRELTQWHQPGQRLEFEPADIFDWFVNADGYLHGGYTMRVARSRMAEGDREAFDRYTGVKHWVHPEAN